MRRLLHPNIAVHCRMTTVVTLVVLIACWVAIRPAEADEAAKATTKVAELMRQLGDRSFDTRERASKALIDLGEVALEPLRQAFQSPDREVARRAAACIAQIERHQKIAALVRQLLQDRDSKRRARAAVDLTDFLSSADRLVPALIQALDDSDPEVRSVAGSVLGMIGPPAKDAAPRMLEILKDAKAPDDVRWTMATRLAKLGPGGEAAVPTLLEWLESDSRTLRSAAALALGDLGRKHRGVVPALIKALKDTDVHVRGKVAGALGCLQEEPDVCVPALVEALRSLRSYRGDSDPRLLVMGALSQFGSKSAQAVPLIRELVEDNRLDGNVRLAAIYTLGDLGPAAQAAVPFLTALLENPGPSEVKMAAIHTLGNLGPAAGAAVPTLTALLKRPSFQEEAAEALSKIEGRKR